MRSVPFLLLFSGCAAAPDRRLYPLVSAAREGGVRLAAGRMSMEGATSSVGSPNGIASRSPLVSPSLVLFVSVLAMSWAAPLVRFSGASPIAISFWRLALSLPFIAAILLARGEWAHFRRLTSFEWMIAGAAGIFLAAHFASWIASVHHTSVAASVALVSTQPVWVAIIALVTLRERPHLQQWIGISLAVAGAGLVGWGDLDRGGSHLLGDLLALVSALLVAGYYVIGRSLRRSIGVWPYVAIVYAAAALTLLLVLLVGGSPVLGPFERRDWIVFLALAVVPTLIGHTGQNYALGFLPAYAVNLTLLGEPIGATLLAWLLPGIREVPPAGAVFGGVLILSGILLGLRRK